MIVGTPEACGVPEFTQSVSQAIDAKMRARRRHKGSVPSGADASDEPEEDAPEPWLLEATRLMDGGYLCQV